MCGMEHDPQKTRESIGKGKVRDFPALHDGIPWKEEPDRKKFSGKENQPPCLAYKRVTVQKGTVITGIHLGVPIIKEGIANLGVSVRLKHTEKAGGEPEKRHNSVVVAKNIGSHPSRGGRSLLKNS